jgi:hypothetical protein
MPANDAASKDINPWLIAIETLTTVASSPSLRVLNTFRFLTLMFVLMLPLVFLMRKPKKGKR